MNNSSQTVPITFWVIAVIALLWNLIGGATFVSNMMITPESLALLPAEQQAMYAENPVWIKIIYGIATLGGIIASIGLLLRKAWSEKLFLVSLIAVLIQMGKSIFSLSDSGLDMQQMTLPIMVILIALFLWYYSKKAIARGWIS